MCRGSEVRALLGKNERGVLGGGLETPLFGGENRAFAEV